MKKFLRKLSAAMVSLGMLCAQAVPARGELPAADFSDKGYLLPIDFSIQEQRAIEENFTENGYQDSTISVTIASGRFEDRSDYWTADIIINDPSQMRTSAAKGDFTNKYATRDGMELCNKLNAVVGLNGDYINGTEKRDFGYVIRQGVLYRDNLDTAGRWDSHIMDLLLIDEDGDFHIVREAQAGAVQDMKIDGKRILNSFCFGPVLVLDGEIVEDFGLADSWINMSSGDERQRVAICQVEKLHYKVVCCSGNYGKNTGLSLPDFTRLVANCKNWSWTI